MGVEEFYWGERRRNYYSNLANIQRMIENLFRRGKARLSAWRFRVKKMFINDCLLALAIISLSLLGTNSVMIGNAQEIPNESGVDAVSIVPEKDKGKPVFKTPQSLPASDAATNEEAFSPFDYTSLYDGTSPLKRLDKTSPIWVSADRKFVILGGKICLRDGLLEFFACRKNSKEHESIVSLDIPPHLIHAALLVIGAKQGTPAKFDPEFVSPTGEVINITVCWRDPNSGALRKVKAQDMVEENESGQTMQSHWVFTGGLFGVDPDGKKYYLANVTGEVFGLANFPGSILDVPFESPSDYSNLYYTTKTENIPQNSTDVILILSRALGDASITK